MQIHCYVYILDAVTYLTSPGMSKDSGDVNWGVCHNGIVVEFLLALGFVLDLSEKHNVSSVDFG